MSNSGENICATCAKGASIAMCYGCQKSFCTRHFVKHRSNLAKQMDAIYGKSMLLQNDLKETHFEESFLSIINAWEQNSIGKIQEIAENARKDLRTSIEKIKDKVSVSLNKINSELASNSTADNYTEIEIDSWIKQLAELRNLLEKPLNISIVEDKKRSPVIRGIKVVEDEKRLSIISLPISETDSYVLKSSLDSHQEYFVLAYGPCKLSENGCVAVQSSYRGGLSQIHGSNYYSSGIHSISFIIENKGKKNIFFGIHSASKRTNSLDLDRSVNGWWNFDFVIVNGETGAGDDNQNGNFEKGDKLTLILDCDNKVMRCLHDRTQQLLNLPINLNTCPYPWQILVKLLTEGDCIRILRS